MTERLPAHLETAGLIRRAEADGGFAAVLRKGDPDRGAITLILREKGVLTGLMERELGPDFTYGWSFRSLAATAESQEVADLIARKERFDADFWLLELDIPQVERFIAETTSEG
ncbi:MAG TPA: DUF1491 family protein [Sphingomicrobium sp.]